MAKHHEIMSGTSWRSITMDMYLK